MSSSPLPPADSASADAQPAGGGAAPPPRKPAGGSLWRSTFIVSAMTLLSRIAGLVRDMVFMNLFGASKLMDAFLVAFKIPNFLRRLFAEGAFSQAFVPVLSEVRTQRGDSEVRRLIDHVAGSLTVILGALTVVSIVFSPAIIFIFAPGFRGDELKFDLAADMLRITFPYLLLISLTAFAGGILNTYGRFGASSFTPVLMNLSMIACAVWLSPLLSTPIMALAWGVLIAGVVQLGFQWWPLRQLNLVPRIRPDFKDPDVKRILTLMVPAMFGVSVSQINLLLDTILASFLVEGSVSWLYTADRLTELPLGLIGIAVATVILPTLSTKHAQKSDAEFRGTIDWALKVIVMVGLPASLAMGVLAEPLIASLFHHGKFDDNAVIQSAMALQALAGGILAFMLIKVFAPAFYARQDIRTPVRIGIIAMVANMVFNLMLVWHLAHVGLSLASTLSAFLNAGLLYKGLHQRGIYRLEAHWARLALRFLAANALMVAVLLWITPDTAWWLDNQGWSRVGWVLLICAAGAATYGIALLAAGFRPRELRHP
ncbi:murein biosynthesis integral membrane protein MurJ [Amnimonas aquatica]|uniref:Probable lipid II flippase MurJ n=1 Tax=Amnimonas aquatica TaxID=2094561 RepID=A0A2P6ATQ2_9GAMM|nr:murein biosynthesis integral membrane protein MurJ [Amnimonas aquatica]PQA47975.1 murein biosynthesis integral membrane protein MurJ [Amnimonas aquatica]